MSNKAQALQEPFLNMLRQKRIEVSIFLVNGIKLQGMITSFDQYVIILFGADARSRKDVTQMVYKHGIATIVPSQPVDLSKIFSEDGEDGDRP